MFETLQEKTEEKAMVQFLERFTDYPFLVKFKNSEYHIGEGEPTFTNSLVGGSKERIL